MTIKRTPFQKILQTLNEAQQIPIDLLPLLPKGWKRVGRVGVLELKTPLLPWKREIGEAYLQHLPELKTMALKVGVTNTTVRQPALELLAGEEKTVTLHKELECKFWIDALKLTFSNGNHAERQRMVKLSKKKEQVIDMFACVGNLSIPIAVHNPTAQIIGIEINPYAHQFLEKNIQENQLTDRYQALLGDNRKITPTNWANRVIMGYFTIDKQQLTKALASLQQQQGGTIHAHGLTTTRHMHDWKKEITTLINTSFPHFKIIQTQKTIIKSVAPGVNHFVNDITITTTNETKA
ncbi:MAG: methyltransferase [Candidatus Heimdallarchaeota archaeon]|nr:MAG: methyltransferase [Candidatus Heimdallarchaeota archaeon]